ncbi:hypothetical protein, partial [Mycoplasma buteonis]
MGAYSNILLEEEWMSTLSEKELRKFWLKKSFNEQINLDFEKKYKKSVIFKTHTTNLPKIAAKQIFLSKTFYEMLNTNGIM